MDEWIAFAKEAQALPWVRAVEVFLASALVAKLVSLLISRSLLRLTLRTDTDLDDQLATAIMNAFGHPNEIVVGLLTVASMSDEQHRGRFIRLL